MELRKLGRNGDTVSAIGLGCMGMSGMYGAADSAEAVRTIQAALDAGITCFNTGDFYGMGHNESLLREGLKGRRESAFISVKFGAQRSPDGSFVGVDARPASVKNFLAYTLNRLGTDHVDLYQPARVDPSVPIEETAGAVGEMVKKGYVRYLGLSEASAATLRRAHATHPVAALEIEYSLIARDIEPDVLQTARELGVSIAAYGVLSRGLLSGAPRTAFGAGDFRAHLPRFRGENLEKNLALLEGFHAFAREKGVTSSQLAIAWVLARGEDIVPLIGARTRENLAEALGALPVHLTAADLDRLDRLVPHQAVAGTRYDAAQMRMLNR